MDMWFECDHCGVEVTNLHGVCVVCDSCDKCDKGHGRRANKPHLQRVEDKRREGEQDGR